MPIRNRTPRHQAPYGAPPYLKAADLPQPPTKSKAYDAAYEVLAKARAEYTELSARKGSIQRRISWANRNYALDAAAATRVGKEPPKDPRKRLNHDLETVDVELSAIKTLMNSLADALDETITEEWLEAEGHALADKAGSAVAALEGLREQLHTVSRQQSLVAWIKGDKMTRKRISEKELAAIEKSLGAIASPSENGTQADYRQRQEPEIATGEDGSSGH